MVYEAGEADTPEYIAGLSRLVLVLVYDSRSPTGRYLSGLLDDIARSLEPVFAVVRVDAASAPGLASRLARSMPRLILFYEGSKLWEQIGFFYSPGSDRYAIRRGLLQALRSRGLTPARLGVRLDF